jgi:hypothetical protein
LTSFFKGKKGDTRKNKKFRGVFVRGGVKKASFYGALTKYHEW